MSRISCTWSNAFLICCGDRLRSLTPLRQNGESQVNGVSAGSSWFIQAWQHASFTAVELVTSLSYESHQSGRQSITGTTHRDKQHMDNLESPIILTCTFLDYGRKPVRTMWTRELHTERPQQPCWSETQRYCEVTPLHHQAAATSNNPPHPHSSPAPPWYYTVSNNARSEHCYHLRLLAHIVPISRILHRQFTKIEPLCLCLTDCSWLKCCISII